MRPRVSRLSRLSGRWTASDTLDDLTVAKLLPRIGCLKTAPGCRTRLGLMDNDRAQRRARQARPYEYDTGMERPADFRSKLRRNREERRRLLTRGERIFGWTFAFLPAVGAVVAVLLLLGGSAPRAIGIGLLILALLVAAT